MAKKEEKPTKSFTIHDLPLDERPRERLQKVGVDNLSTQELLALVIERGKRGQNVLAVAQNLLSHFGNLEKIKEASSEELQRVKGVGFSTACKLQAAFKLGEKTLTQHKERGEKIETPEDVYNLLKGEIGDKKKEHFKLLSLNSRDYLIGIDDVSTGTLDASLSHPREIFRSAIQNSAASIILSHNHPSDDPEPSEDDLLITKRLVEAGKILGIEINDHVIVSQNGFFSFKKRNLL